MARRLGAKTWALRNVNQPLLCEACHNEPAWAFGWQGDPAVCRLVGDCTSAEEFYDIPFQRFVEEGKDVWLTHINRKNWFDSLDFARARDRAGL